MGLFRLILAISVVLFHSTPIFGFELVGGRMAVQAFYIISGFYMSLILNEKYIGKGHYKLFITNRFLRLFPTYWAVCLLTIVVSLAFYLKTNGDNFGKLEIYREYWEVMDLKTFIFFVFTNLVVFFQDLVMFTGFNPESGDLYLTTNFNISQPATYEFLLIPQAWTIAIEITFYLIAPFLVRKKVIVIVGLIATSLFIRIILSYFGYNYDPWTYRFFPSELGFFLAGTISYYLYLDVKGKANTVLISKYAFPAILLITLIYQWVNFTGSMYFYYIIVILFLPYIFILTKKNKMDRYIGELSYPVYIVHILVLKGMKAFDITLWGSRGLPAVLMSVAFAILINELISKPIEKYRRKRISGLKPDEMLKHKNFKPL